MAGFKSQRGQEESGNGYKGCQGTGDDNVRQMNIVVQREMTPLMRKNNNNDRENICTDEVKFAAYYLQIALFSVKLYRHHLWFIGRKLNKSWK